MYSIWAATATWFRTRCCIVPKTRLIYSIYIYTLYAHFWITFMFLSSITVFLWGKENLRSVVNNWWNVHILVRSRPFCPWKRHYISIIFFVYACWLVWINFRTISLLTDTILQPRTQGLISAPRHAPRSLRKRLRSGLVTW